MAGDTYVTVIGNIAADPELRFTPSGAAVANFTIASTPRAFDKASNEWKDGETLWMRCSIWRQAAENVAESLQKGMRVIAWGRLQQRSYEKDGEKRTTVELAVEEVGPSLLWSTAKVARTERQGAPQGGQQQRPQQQPQQSQGQDPWSGGGYTQPDPWSAPQQQGQPTDPPF